VYVCWAYSAGVSKASRSAAITSYQDQSTDVCEHGQDCDVRLWHQVAHRIEHSFTVALPFRSKSVFCLLIYCLKPC